MQVGGLTIDFDAMTVETGDGGTTVLQVRDARVLKLLVDAAPRVVNRSDILDKVWGEDQYPTPRSVDNAIVRLRHALKDEDGQVIRSVRGVGYQWAGKADA
jgi:DNA-binding response OmpR family regulator